MFFSWCDCIVICDLSMRMVPLVLFFVYVNTISSKVRQHNRIFLIP